MIRKVYVDCMISKSKVMSEQNRCKKERYDGYCFDPQRIVYLDFINTLDIRYLD